MTLKLLQSLLQLLFVINSNKTHVFEHLPSTIDTASHLNAHRVLWGRYYAYSK